MKVLRHLLLTILLLLSFQHIHSQRSVEVKLIDEASREPLVAASVVLGDQVYSSDVNGLVQLQIENLVEISCSYIGYETQTVQVNSASSNVLIIMRVSANLLETATVTGSKYETSVAKSAVSIEVMKPDFVKTNNANSVEDVLDKVPGVQIIDGQANIRGGSGWSYGAGSRVLLLVDEMPAMQADAGVPNFSDLPVENISQVEIIKGAASTLYGSAAMNGIINLRTGYAKSKPETEIALSYQQFLSPSDEDKNWWRNDPDGYVPNARQLNVLHRRKMGKLDLVASTYFFRRDSWNQNTFDERNRGTLNLRYRFSDRLNAGINVNYSDLASSDFFFWDFPVGVQITRGFLGNFSTRKNTRYNIDPFINYYDSHRNRHRLKMRYHYINNDNDNEQSNKSDNYYTEYQFQRNFPRFDINLTSGFVWNRNVSDSELFSDTLITATNLASYVQAEKTIKEKFTISGGLRYEFNNQNVPEFFQGVQIPDGRIEDSGLIARIGANWEMADFSFLRASWGQGYRYPTITERLVATQFNGFTVFPNILLESERGWTWEVGFKQGFSIVGLNGFIDLCTFRSEYDNMMEFTFVFMDGNQGFQSQNVGSTIIQGSELNIAGQSEIFGLPVTWLGGYTYIDPKYKDFNEQLQSASSEDVNVLKYRSRENFKMDVESNYKGFKTGISFRYVSHMIAIDNILGIIAGIEAYRDINNQGYRLWDARCSYERYGVKISCLLNNFLNEEYTLRPGLLEAPRNIAFRLDYKI